MSGAGAPVAAPPSAPSGVRASAADVERLMTRGYALLQAGDVASARLFFERAAATGFPEALTAVGQTFDPIELRRRDIIGIKGDPPLALQWYRSAAAAGDPAAAERMTQLSEWMERTQARR
jgi:TPR repeat protein